MCKKREHCIEKICILLIPAQLLGLREVSTCDHLQTLTQYILLQGVAFSWQMEEMSERNWKKKFKFDHSEIFTINVVDVKMYNKCLAVSNPPSFHWLSTVLTYTHSSLTLLWEILAAEAGLPTYPHPPKTTRSPSAAMPRWGWSQFSLNVHLIIAHHM